MQLGDALQRVHEKSPRAARWIENPQIAEPCEERAPSDVGELAQARRMTGIGIDANDTREAGGSEAGHEAVRCVEGSARFPLTAVHQRLECTAKHFGIHRELHPIGSLFAGGEPIAAEHVGEERTELLVGEARTPQVPLSSCD